jgi:hypothetical protein
MHLRIDQSIMSSCLRCNAATETTCIKKEKKETARASLRKKEIINEQTELQ